MTLAILFYAYLAPSPTIEYNRLLWGVIFEALTIALLIMGRQA